MQVSTFIFIPLCSLHFTKGLKKKIAVVNQMNDIVTLSIVHAVPSPYVLTFSTHSFSL